MENSTLVKIGSWTKRTKSHLHSFPAHIFIEKC
jgi:hypothetical protein